MYEPGINDATDFESLKQYYDDELQKISNSLLLGEVDTIECRVWSAYPPRPYDGIIAWLDNSIAGVTTSGLHEYASGVWVKL